MIHTQDKHNLSGEMSFSHDKVSPKSYIGFWVISRKSRFSRISIHLAKNSIYFIIGKYTEVTIDNAIKLSLGMKSEAKSIMNFFLERYIFPPRKFNFIAVSIDFWRRNDTVENRRFSHKSTSNPSFYCSAIKSF